MNSSLKDVTVDFNQAPVNYWPARGIEHLYRNMQMPDRRLAPAFETRVDDRQLRYSNERS